jgi:hypothetical protein
VYFINGAVVDYSVRITDNDGSFYVWARNLDRALQLQAKTGRSAAAPAAANDNERIGAWPGRPFYLYDMQCAA